MAQVQCVGRSRVRWLDYLSCAAALQCGKINPLSPFHVQAHLCDNSVFSDCDEVKAVRRLSRDDAQTFIDLAYKVSLRVFSPPTPAENSVPHRLAYW